MASAARGAEEEVFETPDFAEDGLDQASPVPDVGVPKTANKVRLCVWSLPGKQLVTRTTARFDYPLIACRCPRWRQEAAALSEC